MQTRARHSSDDRAWCENRKITTRAVPAPSPPPRVAAAQRLLTATLPTPWGLMQQLGVPVYAGAPRDTNSD